MEVIIDTASVIRELRKNPWNILASGTKAVGTFGRDDFSVRIVGLRLLLWVTDMVCRQSTYLSDRKLLGHIDFQHKDWHLFRGDYPSCVLIGRAAAPNLADYIMFLCSPFIKPHSCAGPVIDARFTLRIRLMQFWGMYLQSLPVALNRLKPLLVRRNCALRLTSRYFVTVTAWLIVFTNFIFRYWQENVNIFSLGFGETNSKNQIPSLGRILIQLPNIVVLRVY